MKTLILSQFTCDKSRENATQLRSVEGRHRVLGHGIKNQLTLVEAEFTKHRGQLSNLTRKNKFNNFGKKSNAAV